MKQTIDRWSALFRTNAFFWTVVSVVVVYAVFALLGGVTWLQVWLKGTMLWIYQIAFGVVFVAVQTALVARQRDRLSSSLGWAVAGAIVGYASGLIAYVAIALTMPGGTDRLFHITDRSVSESLMVLVLPTILLNWLIGLAVGILAAVASKMRPSMAPAAYGGP